MDLKKHFPLHVSEEGAGLRLDSLLTSLFPDISRSRWIRLIEKKVFTCEGKVLKPSSHVKLNQVIECAGLESLTHQDKPLSEKLTGIQFVGPKPSVIFEDSDILVVNKPCDLAVHPGSGIALEETLIAWLFEENKLKYTSEDWLSLDDDILEEQRPGLVHRLDKPTSGALVIAKNPEMHAALSVQFADRSAGRLYWAVVEDSVSKLLKTRSKRLELMLKKVPQTLALRCNELGQGSFVSQLDRDPADRIRYGVCHEGGRKAITHFAEVSKSSRHSLLELSLETGRTHQIRVHLSFLGFPILGDGLYKGVNSRRLYLHAHTLYLQHPRTLKMMEFHAPLDEQTKADLKELQLNPESLGIAGWKELKSSLVRDGRRD